MPSGTSLLLTTLLFVLIGCQERKDQGINYSLGKRPNIILIVADDHGMNDLGCYGNRAISTPNLDALASEGLRFTRAYATAPSCAASRSVILTGLYNHLNGMYGHVHSYHHFRSHEFLKSLPMYLEEIAGYRTARIGKYHVGPEEVFRFQRVLPSSGRNTAKMVEESIRFIETTNHPFFLYFCTNDPHRGGGRVEAHPLKPDRFGNRDEGYEGIEEYGISPDSVLVPAYLPDLPATRAELVQYYRSVNRVDQGVGKLMRYLKEAGKWDNTIIIYISDNGIAFPGAKTNIYEPGINLPLIVKNVNQQNAGSVTEALVNWSDLTPTILDLAGILGPATDSLKNSFKDYAAGGQHLQTPVDDFHGISFKNVLESPAEEARTESFASHTFHEITMYYPMRSIIKGDYKLIWNLAHPLPYPHASDLWASATWQEALESDNPKYGTRDISSYTSRPEFELYNLQEDPLESINLINSASHQELLMALQSRIKTFQQRTNDPWIVKWDHE